MGFRYQGKAISISKPTPDIPVDIFQVVFCNLAVLAYSLNQHSYIREWKEWYCTQKARGSDFSCRFRQQVSALVKVDMIQLDASMPK